MSDRNLSKINLTAEGVRKRIKSFLSRKGINPKQIKCQYEHCNSRGLVFVPDYLSYNQVKFLCRSHIPEERRPQEEYLLSSPEDLPNPIDLKSPSFKEKITLLPSPQPEKSRNKKSEVSETETSETETQPSQESKPSLTDPDPNKYSKLFTGHDSQSQPNGQPKRPGILAKAPYEIEGQEYTPEQIAKMSEKQAKETFKETMSLMDFRTLKEKVLKQLKIEKEGLPEHRKEISTASSNAAETE